MVGAAARVQAVSLAVTRLGGAGGGATTDGAGWRGLAQRGEGVDVLLAGDQGGSARITSAACVPT
jgi:hypothetical protein